VTPNPMRKVLSFIQEADVEKCDPQTRERLTEAVADVFACTIAGTQAPVASIVEKFAAREFREGPCTVFLSPRKTTPTGSTLINATMANALDMDDGHRLTKGHPGAVVFPAVLAAAESEGASGKEFMDAMLAGYEVAIRAGILAHRLRPEYHCTGSWGAIGAAAGAGKLLKLSDDKMEHALGIAEYHSTYSPMMRCIEVPAMLKDGISWGSMVGISSAYLAAEGFTGIPSLFAFQEAEELTADLGQRYRVNELYYKPYACCRWAQPAIEAMKEIERSRRVKPEKIESITIYTFEESSQLMKRYPENTEEAQYNLFFPLACHLTFGEVGPKEVLFELNHPTVRSLMDRMDVRVDPEIDAQFPEKALSRLEVRLVGGEVLRSGTHQARGDFDYPLSPEEKKTKFFRLTEPVIGEARSRQLYDLLQHITEVKAIRDVTALLQTQSQGSEQSIQ